MGGSFAGLAVANQLRGCRVLILDRKSIGSGQTSACGTMLGTLERWRLTDSVVEVHDLLVLHTAQRRYEFRSPYPWCVFDYERLCASLFERSGADFIQAEVRDFEEGEVRTNRGVFRARCVVDASGWRAALASTQVVGFANNSRMNFGLATLRPTSDADTGGGMHFWYDQAILDGGVAWIFPGGREPSYGIASYGGGRPLREALTGFVRQFGSEPQALHGTYFPFALRSATAGPLFIVGDAAGMCLGLTGEGIRPALFFGEACGRIVRRVVQGQCTLEAGLAEYTSFVEARRIIFRVFSGLQTLLTRLPHGWIDGLADAIHRDRLRRWAFGNYRSMLPEPELKSGDPVSGMGDSEVAGGKSEAGG